MGHKIHFYEHTALQECLKFNFCALINKKYLFCSLLSSLEMHNVLHFTQSFIHEEKLEDRLIKHLSRNRRLAACRVYTLHSSGLLHDLFSICCPLPLSSLVSCHVFNSARHLCVTKCLCSLQRHPLCQRGIEKKTAMISCSFNQ